MIKILIISIGLLISVVTIRSAIDWRLLDRVLEKCPGIYKLDGVGFIIKRGFNGWEYLSNLES